MKGLFIATTPLQLLYSLIYAYSHQLEGQCDVLILKHFKTADEAAEKLRKCSVFKNVYTVSSEMEYGNERFWLLAGAASPVFAMKHYLEFDIREKKYETVYLSILTRFTELLVMASGCKKVVGFDDGLGSYIDDLFKRDLGKRYVTAKRMFRRSDVYPDELALAYPEFYHLNNDIRITPLNTDDTKVNYEEINRIFNYKESDLYRNGKVVFANTVVEDLDKNGSTGFEDTEKSSVKTIDSVCHDDLVVRLHPRELKLDLFTGMTIDNVNNMWELLCKHDITDDHILISMLSTTQFTPKLLYDLEPYLIFTFALYPNRDEVYDKNMMLINNLKDLYRNPEKIYVVEKTEEVSDILRSIYNGR